MADIDMIDAPSGSSAVPKKAVGKAKAGGEGGAEGKKRFEVKKVRNIPLGSALAWTNNLVVECRSSVGLGHCR